MKKQVFLYFLFLILISSCKNNSNTETFQYVYTIPSIQVSSNPDLVTLNIKDSIGTDFYSFVDSIKIIRPEMSDESVIGEIKKIFIVHDTLFVADYFKAKSIFAFDMHGKFLYKIDKKGSGPGEYQSINIVHLIDHEIWMLDWFSLKIIQYNLNGKFLSEERIEPCPEDFIPIAFGNILVNYNCYKENPFRLVFHDKMSSQKETALSFTNTRCEMNYPSSLFQNIGNDKILYRYDLCDTIYQIEHNKIIPKYNLSLYGPSLIKSFIENTKNLTQSEFIQKWWMSSEISRIINFIEMDDYIYIERMQNQIFYISLITKNEFKCNNILMGDYAKYTKNSPFYVKGYGGNTLLATIDEAFANLSKSDQDRFYSHLTNKEDIELLKELDNPNNNTVVCLLYLKVKS